MRTISKAKSWIISDFFVYLYQAKVRVNFVSAFRPDAALPPGRIVFCENGLYFGRAAAGLAVPSGRFVRTSCGVVCRIRHWLRLELFSEYGL